MKHILIAFWITVPGVLCKKMHHVFGQALLSIIYMHCYIITYYNVTNFCCSLNNRSVFKFQNFMKTIKKIVRHGSNPVAEVAKRWKYWKHESSWNICFTIKTKKRFCFQLTNEKMCFLKNNICEDCYECDTFKLAQTESIYLTPTHSKCLGIGFIRNMSTTGFEVAEIQKKDLKRKICILSWKNGFDLFPMSHKI